MFYSQKEPEMTEEGIHRRVDKLNDDQINEKSEELLKEANLNERSKCILRDSDIERKKQLLICQETLANQIKEITEFSSPQQYIDHLEEYSNIDTLNADKILYYIENLRIALTNYPLRWVHEFGYKGLSMLCNLLDLSTYEMDETFEIIQKKCLKCICKFINSPEGVLDFLRHDSCLEVVTRCINYRKPKSAKNALQILAALCSVSEPDLKTKINNKVLYAMGKLVELGSDRFKPIIDCIDRTEDEHLWCACLEFFDAIISQSPDCEIRIDLRNEIMNSGLNDKLEILKNTPSEGIDRQLNNLERHKVEDELEYHLKRGF